MSYAPIPVADIHLSQTSAQVERRARFDKAALSELAESIKSLGLQQPIIARRVNGHFELVAGERRLLAAKQAGLKTIDTIVREYTDEQVLEVQLIENLQREGLHELAEAEGYETLMKRHKLTVEDLVAKVGKSKGYVYARLKLTALCPEARRAFYDDKLNASTALLIARIPDHNLQRRALKEITAPQWDNGPLPYRQAAEHVHENYMLQLARAPFPTGDANLVPAAGPCGSCPKRTGNQKELFGDVKSADVCTDPVCFAAKRDANAARLAAAAKASGKEVIAGAAAKKIAPDGLGQYDRLKGHVRLDERFWSGNKQRTYRSAIGKDVEIKHLQDPETGQLVEIVSEADAKTALKKRGITNDFAGGDDSGRYQAEQRARERKRRVELRFRRVLLETLRPKLATRVGRHELELIAAAFWRRRENETQKEILKLWELEPTKRQYGVDVEKPMLERIPKLTDAELALFLQDLVLAEDLQVWSFSKEGPRQLLATAKRVKVNADQIRRQVQAEMAPKKKPKKSAKGK